MVRKLYPHPESNSASTVLAGCWCGAKSLRGKGYQQPTNPATTWAQHAATGRPRLAPGSRRTTRSRATSAPTRPQEEA